MGAFAVLISAALPLLALAQSSGVTTRYWDCCKGSCSWPGKASVTQPVNTCDINNTLLTNFNTRSACTTGGTAYMCADQTPIVIDANTAYGFAAVNISGKRESDWCCACYELTFTSGPVVGKKMIVQATNTGGDLGDNHFDIAMPGGGVGIFNACSAQYGAPPNGWGERYGGISNRSECDSFPEALKEGCYWRFDWFANADNPTVNWRQVACPAQLTALTGCSRL